MSSQGHKMDSKGWTVKRNEKRWRRSVRQQLKIYAGGRFKTIDDVVVNLLYNICSGMPVSDLGYCEQLFFEYNHGSKWFELFTV